MRKGIGLVRSYGQPLQGFYTKIVGESLTRQDQAHQVNINTIYAKTQKGELVRMAHNMPEYGDFTNVDTYDKVLEQINQANEAFYNLPAEVRREYHDDPVVYYEKITSEAVAKLDADRAEKKKAKAADAAKKELEKARKLVEDNKSVTPPNDE